MLEHTAELRENKRETYDIHKQTIYSMDAYFVRKKRRTIKGFYPFRYADGETPTSL